MTRWCAVLAVVAACGGTPADEPDARPHPDACVVCPDAALDAAVVGPAPTPVTDVMRNPPGAIQAMALDRTTDLPLVAGTWEGATDFDGVASTTTGHGVFVGEIDATGSYAWARPVTIANASVSPVKDVARLPDGAVAIATASQQGAIDVTVIDTDGSVRWTQHVAVSTWELAMDADSTGRVWIAATVIVSSSDYDVLVRGFAPTDGADVHTAQFGGAQANYGLAVACGAGDAVYVSGISDGSIDFGGGARPPGTFLAVFEPDGTHRSSTRFAASGWPFGLEVAPDGDVAIGGYFYGTSDLGGGSLAMNPNNPPWPDLFVGRLDPSGAHESSASFYGESVKYGNALAVDGAGREYLGGLYQGVISDGRYQIFAAGSYAPFIVAADADGRIVWADTGNVEGGIGGSIDSIVATEANGVWVRGGVDGTATFSGGSISGEFLLRLDAP